MPQTPARDKAHRKGYIAGLMGQPSLPGDYMQCETLRRAYESGYDIGRKARRSETE